MTKTLDDYLNDPRIKDEPMGLRITHAMRFKVQDDMDLERLCAYFGCQPGDIMEYVPEK